MPQLPVWPYPSATPARARPASTHRRQLSVQVPRRMQHAMWALKGCVEMWDTKPQGWMIQVAAEKICLSSLKNRKMQKISWSISQHPSLCPRKTECICIVASLISSKHREVSSGQVCLVFLPYWYWILLCNNKALEKLCSQADQRHVIQCYQQRARSCLLRNQEHWAVEVHRNVWHSAIPGHR